MQVNHLTKRWNIYERDREYAREICDRCLAVVEAETKSEAETKGASYTVTGAWAVATPETICKAILQ